MSRLIVAAVAVLALAASPPVIADETKPSSAEIQAELWCKDCSTTLDQTNSGSTREIVRYIEGLIAAGAPKSEIKKKAVEQYGWRLRALPSKTDGPRPTLTDLEGEVMCPVCSTTLDQSSSPIATRMKVFIRARIAAGDSAAQIKAKLVDQFGPAVLAESPKRGFDLLAWLLPLAALGLGIVVVGALAWTWSRRRESNIDQQGAELDPDLERRVDEELARYED